MDGPSSSSATPSDGASGANGEGGGVKYLLPSEGGGETLRNEESSKPRVLNVDPDYQEDDDDCFEDGGCSGGGPPAPLSREMVDGAIARRSRDRQVSPGVKMSIGNYDDMEEDEEEETIEERKGRFMAGMRSFRKREQEEAFDLEPSEDFINHHVTDAMMFNQVNRLDDEPIIRIEKEPKVIQGYLWGGLIGLGSYGKVKEVVDVLTLTRRAAKIMKYDKLRKIPSGWENIRSELSILRCLNHPNVVKLIEVFNLPEKSKVYMIFEYCIGSVQQLIDMEPAKRLTIGEAHAIFRDLCHGLNYLHSKRVSHKDIKPGNLLVSIDMTIKICDFGVAEQISIFQADGRCTKVNGTPKFQPPECVHGNTTYFDGYKVDVWSAGITLYNMVSGKYPFEHSVLLRLYGEIGTRPLVMPTNVQLSHDLKDLISKLCDKNYRTRLNILQTMQHPWFLLTYPEDQGLGRIMERMRYGDRPLTFFPSLGVLFDEELMTRTGEDDDGNPVVLGPPPLVVEGTLNEHAFKGFPLLAKQPGDGPSTIDGAPAPPSGDATARRPSSRSATAPPPTVVVVAPPPPEMALEEGGNQRDAPAPSPRLEGMEQQEAEENSRRRRRRGKPGLFSCIFRQRTDSN